MIASQLMTRFVCSLLLLCFSITAQAQQINTEVIWPSPKEEWGPEEYEAVKNQLEILFPRLPQWDDRDFAPVFARLTNPDNLKQFVDKKVVLKDRFSKLFPTYASFNGITQMYIQAYARNPSYNDEAIKLTEFMLLITHSQVHVLDEMVPTLDPDDPTYATRIIGLAQTRLGVSRMAHGAIMMLGERNRYSVELRKSLAAIIEKTWPSFVKKMDPDVRDALTRLLRRTSKEEQDEDLKKTVAKIAETK